MTDTTRFPACHHQKRTSRGIQHKFQRQPLSTPRERRGEPSSSSLISRQPSKYCIVIIHQILFFMKYTAQIFLLFLKKMYFFGRFVFDWNLNFFLKKLKVCIVFYEMSYKLIWFDCCYFFSGNVTGLAKLLVHVLFAVVLILAWNWASSSVIVYNNNILSHPNYFNTESQCTITLETSVSAEFDFFH